MNGITVDNRIENLALAPVRPIGDTQLSPVELEAQRETRERNRNPAQSIYWRAMQQLPVEAAEVRPPAPSTRRVRRGGRGG